MPRYLLLNNSGSVRKRTVRKVIRFRGYNRRIDPRNYWREQLMLFVPWRDEELDLLVIDTIEFGSLYRDEIVENSGQFYKDRNLGDEEIQGFADEAELHDEDAQDNNNHVQWVEDEEILADAMVNPIPQTPRQHSKADKFLPPTMLPEEEYLRLMRTLNHRQRRFVFDILHCMKTSEKQLCTFLSGGAGVGKSHAITAIVQSTLRFFNCIPGRDLSQPPVVVMAFTGKAAWNVLGITMHHTLRLRPMQHKNERLTDLDASSLNSLRKKLGGLKLLIIDEISMVSVRMLYDMDQRLRQITGVSEAFGGIAVLVVGHLQQLGPIAAHYVFDVPKHLPNAQLVGNYLWRDNFTIYELTEIMRQKGEAEFCKALNNMSEGRMDLDDIALLRTREISENLVPPVEALWPFKTNDECAVRNNQFHNDLATDGVLSTAEDCVTGRGSEEAKKSLLENAKTWNVSDTDGLRYKTYLKVGGEYFISTNVNVADGLFNRATGNLKAIEYSAATDPITGRKPVRVWLDFKFPMIGAMKRKAAAALINRRAETNENYRNWVPIEKIKKTLTKSFVYQGLQLVRVQMPLVACNGMTVAKSQGSTMPCVVICTRGTGKQQLTREDLYVACSRATGINSLYIDGIFTEPEPPDEDDQVTKELARIQTRPYQFKLGFLQDIPTYYHKFYFHNVQSLNIHLQDAACDPCVTSADLIAFVEPHLLDRDALNFPGFHVLHRTNCTRRRRKRRLVLRNSEGAVLLLKDNTPSTSATALPLVNQRTSLDGHCIFLTVKYGRLTIVVIYKSPTFPKPAFRQMLQESLSEVNQDVVYVGDINLDLSNSQHMDIVEIFAEYGIQTQLDLNSSSTNLETHLDICFSDVSYLSCWYYESYYSYHKPICVAWPQF